jgi:hypothetical protein
MFKLRRKPKSPEEITRPREGAHEYVLNGDKVWGDSITWSREPKEPDLTKGRVVGWVPIKPIPGDVLLVEMRGGWARLGDPERPARAGRERHVLRRRSRCGLLPHRGRTEAEAASRQRAGRYGRADPMRSRPQSGHLKADWAALKRYWADSQLRRQLDVQNAVAQIRAGSRR